MKSTLSAALAGGAVALGAYRVRRPKLLRIPYSDVPTKVLVVGGRFGGLAAVRELSQAFEGSQDEHNQGEPDELQIEGVVGQEVGEVRDGQEERCGVRRVDAGEHKRHRA